jgi:hypothetical protein
MKTTSNRRQPAMEDDQKWKTISNEDKLKWKTKPPMEEDLQWKMISNGR